MNQGTDCNPETSGSGDTGGAETRDLIIVLLGSRNLVGRVVSIGFQSQQLAIPVDEQGGTISTLVPTPPVSADGPTTPRRILLSPAYEMNVIVSTGRQGVQIARSIMPLLAYGTALAVSLPEGTPFVRVAVLSQKEQAQIIAGIDHAEKIRLSIRAAESGLSLGSTLRS